MNNMNFTLTFQGTVSPDGGDATASGSLSCHELIDNLGHAVKVIVGNGLVTGESAATLEVYESIVSVTEADEPPAPAAQFGSTASVLQALRLSEQFMSGFEGDGVQEGIGEMLAAVRSAIAEVETDMAKAESVEQLRAEVEAGIRKLRSMIDEPVTIDYEENIYLEVAPAVQDSRINVCHRQYGWTCVNYTGEGVIVDVFDAKNIDAQATVSLHRNDLMAAEEATE
ncbi:hypothetical protein [Pseudomonas sp. 2FE]|uniref:hypothetical protein n=1 Tax=Pseudomonas sp. 2FE TaxID=2502190 RepID=UPI0010F81B06|nr:hypothetical protein [Pseudomonas sp. 2FE]